VLEIPPPKMGTTNGKIKDEISGNTNGNTNPAQEMVTDELLDDVFLANHACLKLQLRYKSEILLNSSDNAVTMD
jgi:hypothetical protein